MKPGRAALLAVGSLLALLSFAVLAAGGVLAWATATQRDGEGYFSSADQRFATSAYAITSDRIDLHSVDTHGWFVDGDHLADVKVSAKRASNEGAIFVGVGPVDDVEAYLSGVAHDEVTRIETDPFDVRMRRSPGSRRPALPGEQAFWAAKVIGPGTQTLRWEVQTGDWMLVVMNADASEDVRADIGLALKVSFLGPLLGALFGGGGVLLALGVALIIVGAHGLGHDQTSASAGGSADARTGMIGEAGAARMVGTRSPVRLEGHLDEPLSRWLWLVKWLLVLPHLVILVVLWIAFAAITVVAGFAILFSGKYPRSLFDVNVGILRWTWRVTYYASSALATDRYPPFSFGPVDTYPATLEIEYPTQLSRGLVLVKWWLLVLPHYVIVAVFTAGWTVGGPRFGTGASRTGWAFGFSGGLIGVCSVIAAVALLFSGRYPRGLHDFVMGLNRWVYRVIAYAALMTDQYPPFHFDGGPNEPESDRTDTSSAISQKDHDGNRSE